MKRFRTVSVFDTSISTLNVGDGIIMDAVTEVIDELFQLHQQIRIPSHEKIGITSLSILRRSEARIVGGSNILSSYMNKYPQWKLSPFDAWFMKNTVTLLGVGWRNYQGNTNLYTRTLLRRILKSDGLHSVRDSYTENKLREIGISNVVNTGCPTMWNLTARHCETIPSKKAKRVIFTLTDYNRNVEHDSAMIETLKAKYGSLLFWVQGSRDLDYFKSFGNAVRDVSIVAPNIKQFNSVLDSGDIDYVGTRLHAGIRALQRGRRSIIIGIDNRAEEKRKDFNLPVLERPRIKDLAAMIESDFRTEITLPLANIRKWRQQFVYEDSQDN
ncbi:MAG: polysaccharide pyruvyl transferase family protein [Chryseolinea sp.]